MSKITELGDILVLPLSHCRAKDIARLMCTCRWLFEVSTQDSLWHLLLFHDFNVVTEPTQNDGSSRKLYNTLASKFNCLICLQSMWRHSQEYSWRCPCTTSRIRCPLNVLCLDATRVDDPFDTWPHFSNMRDTLSTMFTVTWSGVPRLTEDVLQGVNLVFLNMTTATDSLDEHEQAALCSFFKSGGSGLLSAFSNWSINNQYHMDVIGPIGIEVRWLNAPSLSSPLLFKPPPCLEPAGAALRPIQQPLPASSAGSARMYRNIPFVQNIPLIYISIPLAASA